MYFYCLRFSRYYLEYYAAVITICTTNNNNSNNNNNERKNSNPKPNENRQSKAATVVECDGQVFALLEEHWQLACCNCLSLSGCLAGWLAGWLAGVQFKSLKAGRLESVAK